MHKHHIVPKHMGGTDDPSNIVEITVAEHAEAHHLLFEKYGRWQDRIAWHGLAGIIDHEEAVRQAKSEAMKGNQHLLGFIQTDKQKDIARNLWLGKKRPEHSKLMKESGILPPNMKGQSWTQVKVTCPHCDKTGGKANMLRYHFDNCKAA